MQNHSEAGGAFRKHANVELFGSIFFDAAGGLENKRGWPLSTSAS